VLNLSGGLVDAGLSLKISRLVGLILSYLIYTYTVLYEVHTPLISHPASAKGHAFDATLLHESPTIFFECLWDTAEFLPFPRLELDYLTNMLILPLVGYLGSIAGFCFLTLAIGLSPCTPASAVAERLTLSSVWAVLPLRACRGTHRYCEEDPHAVNLLRHRPTTSPLHRRSLSLRPHASEYLFACRLPR
jgi:hypothetical protein